MNWMGVRNRLSWYLTKLNYRRRIHVNGVTTRSPSIYGLTCRVTETWMIALLSALLKRREGAFLDVGVNLGQTLVKVKALDPRRVYVGFEPNPACVFYVRELIKSNRFENCTLVPAGLFTQDGILTLDLYSDSPTDIEASLVAGVRPTKKVHSRVFVPTFRFECIAEALKIGDVGIVKIDVEGAELDVVRSLLKVIQRHRPFVLLEVFPVYSSENVFRKDRQAQLEQIFAAAQYTLFQVKKTTAGDYAGLAPLETIGIHSDLDRCDHVMAPKERAAELLESGGASFGGARSASRDAGQAIDTAAEFSSRKGAEKGSGAEKG